MTGIIFQFFKICVGLLPWHIDNPLLLFGNALKLAFTAVLHHTHQAPDADDLVQVQLQHPDLKSNGGYLIVKTYLFVVQVFWYSFFLYLKDVLTVLSSLVHSCLERWIDWMNDGSRFNNHI